MDSGGNLRTNPKSTTVCDASQRIEKHLHQYIRLKVSDLYLIEAQWSDLEVTTKRVMKEAALRQQRDIHPSMMRQTCISATLIDTPSSRTQANSTPPSKTWLFSPKSYATQLNAEGCSWHRWEGRSP